MIAQARGIIDGQAPSQQTTAQDKANQNPYPNLGFNPVPGAPADVAVLRGQINTAADAVKETNGLLSRLRNSNDDVWKGDGGDAFRANFDATLAQDLGYAQNSLEKAVGLLGEWHTNLVSFHDTATGFEAEAAEARGQHAQAVATLQQARSNPDLGLANTAAIAGLLAVVTPPPIDAIALGVALVAGAGALALDLTDAEMRNDLLHGSLSEKLGAGMTISGDALGLIPGVGALAKVGNVAALGDAVGDVGRLEGMARAWSEAAHNPGVVNKFMTEHNVGKVTDALSSSGLTTGTHRLLQFTGVEGAHGLPDPAVALTVFKRAKTSITGLVSSGIESSPTTSRC